MSENKSHYKIRKFIERRGYSYSVTDVLNGHQKRKDDYYNSFSMNDCIDNLEREIESVINSVKSLLLREK